MITLTVKLPKGRLGPTLELSLFVFRSDASSHYRLECSTGLVFYSAHSKNVKHHISPLLPYSRASDPPAIEPPQDFLKISSSWFLPHYFFFFLVSLSLIIYISKLFTDIPLILLSMWFYTLSLLQFSFSILVFNP